MTHNNEINLQFTGNYSLADSISLAAKSAFVAPLTDDEDGKVIDLAFPLEDSWHSVGVRIKQPKKEVHALVLANPGRAKMYDIKAQLEQILSLDVDGSGLDDIANHDKVAGKLLADHSGIRPVLFTSPYEAAARAIIGHQLPLRQAASITARIAKDHGIKLDLNGKEMYAFPTPEVLHHLPHIDGLAERKVEQLRVLGGAADEVLNSNKLRKMSHEEAMPHLQKLPGIGPFSAELILMRGLGDADAFPHQEKKLHGAMTVAYGLGSNPSIKKLEDIAEKWKPYRNWVGLLFRNFTEQGDWRMLR